MENEVLMTWNLLYLKEDFLIKDRYLKISLSYPKVRQLRSGSSII